MLFLLLKLTFSISYSSAPYYIIEFQNIQDAFDCMRAHHCQDKKLPEGYTTELRNRVEEAATLYVSSILFRCLLLV